jgi:hypothetical protein
MKRIKRFRRTPPARPASPEAAIHHSCCHHADDAGDWLRLPAARGLLQDEVPLRPDIHVAAEFTTRLGLAPAREGTRAAIGCIVANSLVASWQGNAGWVFYSRCNSYFASVRQLAPPWYTRRAIVAAVDLLVAGGFLEERRTAPSPMANHRSRLCATPKLIAAAATMTLSDLRRVEAPRVVFRSRDNREFLDPRKVLSGPELIELNQLARDVDEQNRSLSEFSIDLDHDGLQRSSTGLIRVGEFCINPRQRTSYRVFNGDLQHGGRWYGPWWQGVPAWARAAIIIDGKPTVEVDFAACQVRLMFAHLGLSDPLDGQIRHADPSFDLYRIEGVERVVIKLALLIMINAKDRRSARAALAANLKASAATDGERANALQDASRILGAVQDNFTALQSLWFTGIGLRMQRLDSDICAVVQQRMRAQGLPVLSIHDAFITWRHAEPQLRVIMKEEFRSACRTARP